mmetsp:Transcript_7787/g.11426  ORF Transcript_7787/g.11426 Transcript_7787/m.11426 type:complete len:339 (+) Transcript_7787:120-1136(+)|eukprot:CAMPEP_0197237830 /NCGR_PEP_ID=MMETSP1429-20130617/4555_1 /TAXON_ID=49237 /ORGANISM="Chaetoceros  sp., Strain UNC1202" /LENGTH=338 /DNA_ID=CAMNT_0042696907 /DNA_START=9 /DNA_END=1025 /DNA_ORIENTATION=-
MPQKIPPELKKITQYIRRAEELANQNSPQTLIVSFHCRQYAVQTGIPLATTPAAKSCLGDILTDLEVNRSKMGNFSRDEKYNICRDFAFKIFEKADVEDRAGNANKATARTFYAAASFLDVLKQFQDEEEQKGEEAVEEQKKSFYAKWKATDILKAIKEGREVKPGGYGEEQEDDDDNDDNDNDVEESPPAMEGTEVGMDGTTQPSFRISSSPPPAYNDTDAASSPSSSLSMLKPPPPMAPHALNPPMTLSPPPLQPMPTVPVPAPKPQPSPSSGGGFMSSFFGVGGGDAVDTGKYSKAVLADAKELTKFALSALDSKDGDLAIDRLKDALVALGHDV